MPELPEVEFARGCLERWLSGERLVHVEASPGRVIRRTPVEAFAALAGHAVTSVERRGKWLLMRFDGENALLAHLGMTGKFELAPRGDDQVRWSRVRFVRRDGAVVHYRDPRQFGRLVVKSARSVDESEPFLDLGPDAYEPTLTSAVLRARLLGHKRSIKDVLMDQTVLAGLGNIQVTDALYLAKIHPLRRSSSLDPGETAALAKAIRTSLRRTLAMNKGDKIVYVEETKRQENPFLIYGKAGEPCPRCGTPLEKLVISARTTSYCPHCQRLLPESKRSAAIRSPRSRDEATPSRRPSKSAGRTKR